MEPNVNNEIKRINLIDPNKFTHQYADSVFGDNMYNLSVPSEDLSILVELSTMAKARTVLISSKDSTSMAVTNSKITVNFNDNKPINLMTSLNDSTTGNQNYLTTNYTNISTQLDPIDEALGITSIDIEFNSSQVPLVTINFVDIRGAAIFQAGATSKYNVFFRLPYPLYQLKVKGFYGKPVTYCLHMTKFTSKFNSQTGNFEITTNFVGYTYALLSDMLMTYLRAAGDTNTGKQMLAERNLISINQLIRIVAEIDGNIKGFLPSNQSAKNLSNIQQAQNILFELLNNIKSYQSNLEINVGSKTQGSLSFVNIISPNSQKDNDVTNSFNGIQKLISDTIDSYNLKVGTANDLKISQNLSLNDITVSLNAITSKDVFNNPSIHLLVSKKYNAPDNKTQDVVITRLKNSLINTNNGQQGADTSIRFIDFTDLTKRVNELIATINDDVTKIEQNLSVELYKNLYSALKFEPTIKHITKIFTAHIEILLKLIFDASSKFNDPSRVSELSSFLSSDKLDIKNSNNVIYPWPEYQDNNTEEYLGKPGVLTNPNNVPEIQLVDDLFDKILHGNDFIENLNASGPKAWFATNPIDSLFYQTTKPYDRLPAATPSNDLAVYIQLRAIAFLNMSNFALSDDEIKNFAESESNLIIEKFDNNFNVINGLLTTYSTPQLIRQAKAKINGEERTVLTSNFTYNLLETFINSSTYINSSVKLKTITNYTYIQEKDAKGNLITGRYIVPTDKNFFDATYNVGSEQDSNFRVSTRMTNPVDLDNFIDTAYYVDIINGQTYDNFKAQTISSNPPCIIDYTSISNLPNISTSDSLKQAGFEAGNGVVSVQDFRFVDYKGNYGVTDKSLLYSLFYDNTNKYTPFVMSGRTIQFLPNWDLYNPDGSSNNFIISSSLGDGFFTKNYSEAPFYKDLLTNHTGLDKSVQYYINNDDKKDSLTIPFFGFGIKHTEDYFFNLFGSRFYNNQLLYGKAFLFLHCFPWRGLVDGVNKLKDAGFFNNTAIKSLFKFRSGFIQVPKLFPAFIGGLIWRYEIGGKQKNGDKFLTKLKDFYGNNLVNNINSIHDPIKFYIDSNDNKTYFDKMGVDENYEKLSSTPKTYEYLSGIDTNIAIVHLTFAKTFAKPSMFFGYETYHEIEDIIINLPTPAKQVFLNQFFSFVNNEFTTLSINETFEISVIDGNGSLDEQWINSFNKIFDKKSNNIEKIKEYLFINPDIIKDNYVVFSYYSDYFYNYIIEYKQNSDADNKLKELFFSYDYIANCNVRMWNTDNLDITPAIKITDGGNFDNYLSLVLKNLQEKQKTKQTQKFNDVNNLTQIKFEIYRTLKKIYDKWVSNVDKPEDILFQCCTTGVLNGNATRLDSDKANNKKNGGNGITLNLIDSFRFIDRSFNDIGDKFQINPMLIKNLLVDNSDISFYDLMSRVLTDNNFNFISLPTYIDYSKQEEVKSIFQTYPYYDANKITTSGPSFVCMYVGQTSTKLDFGNTITGLGYPNDGIDLTNQQTVPQDFNNTIQDGETPTAAFVVRYGQQNQNIFKDIVLDQAEFTETDESLKIADSIANTYSQTNQSYVGQNLYNIYSIRSYKAEVSMMGNAMIQPMMYFQLENIPMFHGAYLIIKVKHNIVPNKMSTTFTGVRIKKTQTPLINIKTLYTSILKGYQLPSDANSSIVNLNESINGPAVNSINGPAVNASFNNYVNNYYAILKQNIPTNKNITGRVTNGNTLYDTAKNEYQLWGNGTLLETTQTGISNISKYFNNTNYKLGLYDIPKDPWSAAFVSYLLNSIDKNFPVAALHYDYVTNAMDGKNGYEAFPLKSGLTIKAEIGDILIEPRSGEYTFSHGNVIMYVFDNKATLIGGNLGSTVQESEITLDNGNFTDNVNVKNYLLLIKKTGRLYYTKKLADVVVNTYQQSINLKPERVTSVVDPIDKDFYTDILIGLGAPLTPENYKFLYAWRQDEAADAMFNPFNTTYPGNKSQTQYVTTNYDCSPTRNYASRSDGLNATIKSIQLNNYTNIRNGLIKNIGAHNIASNIDELLNWGTGYGIIDVLAGHSVNPPQIATPENLKARNKTIHITTDCPEKKKANNTSNNSVSH